MTDDVVRAGKYVAISYTIVDERGEAVEHHDLPVGYVHGGDTQLLGGMDAAVTGLRAGDEVRKTLPPVQAFGERDESLVFTDDIENVPAEYRRLGAEVTMQNDQGESRTFYVTAMDEDSLTLDGNHPLAGQTIDVTVKIHEVRDAKPGEDKTSGIHVIKMSGPTTLN